MAPRSFTVDGYDGAMELALERRWTDGLPIVPPTPERVSAVVERLGGDPECVVAELPPAMGAATVEKVATNAVMAGCLPDYAPVVVAALEAMADPGFNLTAIQTTTNSAAPLAIVNGPVRDALGMNWGRGALGPGNRANATIGRAIRLVLMNVGGALPGTTDRSATGTPAKLGFCFAEDEDGNPWGPLHASRAHNAGESAVTMVAAQGTLTLLAITSDPDVVIELMADALRYDGCKSVQEGDGHPVFVLPRGHARLLHEHGYDRAAVQREIFVLASRPPSSFRYKSPVNEWNEQDGLVRPCRAAEDLLLVVAGAAEPYHLVYIPNFGETRAVTRRVLTSGY